MESFEKFLKFTKLKLIIMSISTLTPIIIVVVMSILGNYLMSLQNTIFQDILKTDMMVFTYLLLAVFEGVIIYKVVRYLRIVSNNEYAKQEFIKKNDERNRFIKTTSNNLVTKIFIYVLVVSAIFAAFTNRVLFYTLLALLATYLIIYIAVNIHYFRKY